MMRGWTEHKAWMVRPKWRPWWMRGSFTQLEIVYLVNNMRLVVSVVTYGFFLGPSWRALLCERRPKEDGGVFSPGDITVKSVRGGRGSYVFLVLEDSVD